MIFKLLRSGVSREGSENSKMEERIREAGPEGISKSDLTLAFRDWKPRDRRDRLETLIEAGTITPKVFKTAGRDKTVYVHRDYSPEIK